MNRGFSLVEITLYAAVLGIMMAAVLPATMIIADSQAAIMRQADAESPFVFAADRIAELADSGRAADAVSYAVSIGYAASTRFIGSSRLIVASTTIDGHAFVFVRLAR